MLSKKYLVQKSFGSKKIFALKKFWVKKSFGQKNLCPIGRVNPRGWIYGPPPENSRVKIVLGC